MNRRDLIRLLAVTAAGCGLPNEQSLATATAAATKPERGTARMTKRRIPSSDEEIPVIGMGTWQTFDVATASPELEAVLRDFASLGGKLIDSSPMYGRSEEIVGELADRTSLAPELFVATKVWTSGKREGIEQMNASMKKLRRSKIDLMQVHNLVDVDTHLDTLRGWKKEGKIRYLGVTHYTASAYQDVEAAMRRHQIDFLQINYSALERTAEQRILPLAQEKGIAVIANRPFAEGALLRRLASKPLPAFAAELGCSSWAQLLLKFVLSHPAITCTIPATSKVKHLRDNMGAGSGPMPDETMRLALARSVTS